MRSLAPATPLALLALACAAPHPAPSVPPAAPTLQLQPSGTTQLLQAVSVVDARTVWVSGHGATWARTTDGGATWHASRLPDDTTLEFRDVHAASADTAWLLAAGPGDRSRIYATTDGGRSWTLQFVSHDSAAFFDCLDFRDARHGVAMSDAVRGRFVVIVTDDGGATWTPVDPSRLPPARDGEGGFAASGTCVVARPPATAWIATGNAGPDARVLRTTDGGASWTALDTPLRGAPQAGILSLAFRDAMHGAALGGDIANAAAPGPRVALTSDGGTTWTPGGEPSFGGAVYGAAWVPGAATPTLVAVGPGGASVSRDDGRHWAPLDTAAYWAVGFASPSAGWAVGPHGRIARLRGF